jgi:hypothetical protein
MGIVRLTKIKMNTEFSRIVKKYEARRQAPNLNVGRHFTKRRLV